MKDGLHIDKIGNQRWYLNGKLHRLDGPAIEWANGDKMYFIMDYRYTYDEWLEKRKSYLIQENLKSLI